MVAQTLLSAPQDASVKTCVTAQTGVSVLLWIFFSSGLALFAQSPDTTAIRYGLGGAYMLNQHQANFFQIPGIPTCCTDAYGVGSSTGWNVSLSGEIPLKRIGEVAVMSLSGRVVLSGGIGANLISLENVPASSGQVSTLSSAIFQHNFSPSLSLISVEPFVSLRLWKWLSLYAGIQVGTWLQKTYTYDERISSPSNIVYINQDDKQFDGKTIRNIRGGELPNSNPLQFALVGGFAYELPVTRTGTILPTLEAFYTYNLTSPVSGVNWRISSLRVGATLRFSPYRTTELTAQEIEQKYQDSLRSAQELTKKALAEAKEARKKELAAKIDDIRPIYFDDDDSMPSDSTARNVGGKISAKLSLDQFVLNVRKVASVQTIELLPLVFFNENSSVLPVRYKTYNSSDIGKFSLDSPLLLSPTQSSPLAAYYQVLNIIGKRLQANPAANVILTGVATQREQDGNWLADRLAERRAQAVSNYLQDVWRVQASRITTKSSVVASSQTAEEQEELRRVDVSSADSSITAPVRIEAERRIVTPPGLQIGLQIGAGAGLKQWDLDISQSNGREVITLLNANGGATYPERFVWDMRSHPPISSDDIAMRLSIDDASNNKFESPIISIKVQETAQKGRLETFTILQFSPILASRIRSSLQPASTVIVRSQDAGLAQSLGLSNADQKPPKKPLFDTKSPEGRFYNRGGVVEVR